jgi:hypothetical protein
VAVFFASSAKGAIISKSRSGTGIAQGAINWDGADPGYFIHINSGAAGKKIEDIHITNGVFNSYTFGSGEPSYITTWPGTEFFLVGFTVDIIRLY